MFKNLFKTKTVKCLDGSTKFVYRNIDDAFPMFIPGVQLKTEGSIQGWENIKASINADYANKIQGLMYQLDELNQGMMIDFRASYVVYTTDPCGNSKIFAQQVERITAEHRRIRSISVQIKHLITLTKESKNKSDEILKIFLELANSLGGEAGVEAARIEIASNRTIAANWANARISVKSETKDGSEENES